MKNARDSMRRDSPPSPAALSQEQVSSRGSNAKNQPSAKAEQGFISRGPESKHSSPSHEKIAQRAYQIWEESGRPSGTDRADWFEAERLLGVVPHDR